MRNLLLTLVFCGVVQLASASAECPATPIAPTQTRPAAELISSAAAQAPLATTPGQPDAVMLPASVHGNATHLMGWPPGAPAAESPRRGSRLALVLAALGVMLVIVVRRIGASS